MAKETLIEAEKIKPESRAPACTRCRGKTDGGDICKTCRDLGVEYREDSWRSSFGQGKAFARGATTSQNKKGKS